MKKKLVMAVVALAAVFGSQSIFAQNQESPKSEEEKIAAIIAAMPLKPGMDAPDFTLKDVEGNDVSLSSFAGKWVVLDFWGTWCRFCVQGIPAMKEAYAAYHPEGLEIIGIDCNEPEENWKAGVAKFELPWVNVYNPAPRGEGVGADYGVKAYPTKFIIDPEGKVVATYLGEDPAFYQALEQIFK